MNNLKTIIANTNQAPTITNNESNFVVVTYWWGRGNKNNNTARPCVSYYEDFFKKIISLSMASISYVSTSTPEKLPSFIETLENMIQLRQFKEMFKLKITEYYYNIYTYAGIPDNAPNKIELAMQFLEKGKATGKTPTDYEFKNEEYMFVMLSFIAREFIKLNKENILNLYENAKKMEALKETFLNKINNVNYKEKLAEIETEKNNINDLIKRSLNIVKNYGEDTNIKKLKMRMFVDKIFTETSLQNKSLNQIFIQELRYLSPLTFEQMIGQWQEQCTRNNCNFLAIEYPEFAKPGGYQMAINAKPLFIRKCLELCGGKSVVYIDGDMNIRKYPVLFDMKDVDYMARGWWIDPRSSYKFEESISYDPYTFETSGGTMFFSNSEESRLLLDMWILESEKSHQSGKADDRIISLIFNTKKMLLNMKIIQLPIEYLWLTLDYNERLLESEIYDYNFPLMDSSIVIDHPECLTSEDTATGSGASSDRTPKYYTFLHENIDPVSENFYECLAFPEPKYVEGLKDYLKYMSDVFYIDDGNKILYRKGYVEQGRHTSENEQPLYVFPYDKKFGTNVTELSNIIIQRAASMNSNGLFAMLPNTNIAEITQTAFTKEEDPQRPDTVKSIALIYKLLNEGKDVLYKPPTTNPNTYQSFLSGLDSKYKNTEFAFVPIFNGISYNDIYRPMVDINNCFFISHKSAFMKQFITMFEALEDMSSFINNGFYQLMSSVRVAYLINKKTPAISQAPIGGGEYDDIPSVLDFETEYLSAMESIDQMKQQIQQGGVFRKRHRRTIRRGTYRKKNGKKTRRYRK